MLLNAYLGKMFKSLCGCVYVCVCAYGLNYLVRSKLVRRQGWP